MCLLANLIVLSKTVTIGYSKHPILVDVARIPDLSLLGNISLIFTVTALSWSKTSFAVTVLRVTSSWCKKLVWFIIILMNVLFFLGCTGPLGLLLTWRRLRLYAPAVEYQDLQLIIRRPFRPHTFIPTQTTDFHGLRLARPFTASVMLGP